MSNWDLVCIARNDSGDIFYIVFKMGLHAFQRGVFVLAEFGVKEQGSGISLIVKWRL